jgi:L-gulonate 3-dehydrogenase
MRVVILGSGIIGRSWSVIFARAKHQVLLFDAVPSALDAARMDIGRQLEQLGQFDLLYNQTAEEILTRIETIDSTDGLNALFQEGIDHVQECIPEDVALKTQLFLELDQRVSANVLIASSSSCIVPSNFTESMKTRHRCIVA